MEWFCCDLAKLIAFMIHFHVNISDVQGKVNGVKELPTVEVKGDILRAVGTQWDETLERECDQEFFGTHLGQTIENSAQMKEWVGSVCTGSGPQWRSEKVHPNPKGWTSKHISPSSPSPA